MPAAASAGGSCTQQLAPTALLHSALMQASGGMCKKVPALLAGASVGASCAAELEEWNSAAMDLGGLTGFAHVNLSAADFKQAEAAGVATARLQAEPCRLQAVLLPFGDKDEAMPFKGVPHVTLHMPLNRCTCHPTWSHLGPCIGVLQPGSGALPA